MERDKKILKNSIFVTTDFPKNTGKQTSGNHTGAFTNFTDSKLSFPRTAESIMSTTAESPFESYSISYLFINSSKCFAGIPT